MKKFLALALVVLMSLTVLCACGGGSVDAPNGGDSNGNKAADNSKNVGDFTIGVPNGWYYLAQTDMFGETDEDGNYPLKTDAVGLIKDGSSEFDAFSKPTLYIYLYDAESIDVETSKIWYEDVEDIDGLMINGTLCNAFTGSSSDYVYTIIFYPISAEKTFQINVPTDWAGNGGVTVEEAMPILESLALN